MWQRTIASLSWLILINLCLAADVPLRCVKLARKLGDKDRLWIAKIYRRQSEHVSAEECVGAIIDQRAILIHSDCSSRLVANSTFAMVESRNRFEVDSIIQHPDGRTNIAILKLSKRMDLHKEDSVSLPGQDTLFESCECILIATWTRWPTIVDASDFENDTVTRMTSGDRCSEDPSLICSRNFKAYPCKSRQLLVCPMREDVTQFVLAGITDQRFEPIVAEEENTCKMTFANIAYERTWIDSVVSSFAQMGTDSTTQENETNSEYLATDDKTSLERPAAKYTRSRQHPDTEYDTSSDVPDTEYDTSSDVPDTEYDTSSDVPDNEHDTSSGYSDTEEALSCEDLDTQYDTTLDYPGEISDHDSETGNVLSDINSNPDVKKNRRRRKEKKQIRAKKVNKGRVPKNVGMKARLPIARVPRMPIRIRGSIG